jgi:hypothetical protein
MMNGYNLNHVICNQTLNSNKKIHHFVEVKEKTKGGYDPTRGERQQGLAG